MRGQKRRGRPCSRRKVNINIEADYFKPRGILLRDLEEVELTKEELEALRLKNVKKLDQTEAAESMKTSQSTFQRILSSAYEKISDALVTGKAIKITK